MEDMFKTFIASDGTSIRYVDIGEGKPLLYLHGFGGSTAVQLPIFKKLKNDFRCICFDQRGYGKTAASGDIGLRQSAKDAKEFLEYLHIDNVIFLGYSMGAGVMLSYIEQFGCQYIDRLIIGEAAPKVINDDTWNCGLYQGWYKQEHFEKDLNLMKSNYKLFFAFFAIQTFFKQTPDVKRDFNYDKLNLESLLDMVGPARPTLEASMNISPEQEASNRRYWESVGKNDFRETLKKITKPAAIFYADPGSIYDPRAAEYMAKTIPNKPVLYRFEGCSHMAKDERSDLFIKYITEFSQL